MRNAHPVTAPQGLKVVRAIEVANVEPEKFRRIVAGLRIKPETSTRFGEQEKGDARWTIMSYPGSGRNQALKHVILFPQHIHVSQLRKLIGESLGLIISDYDHIVVHCA